MNRIWIVAGYNTPPSDSKQKQISERLSAISQSLFPGSTIEVETGEGSWWVVVGVTCAAAGLWLLKVVGEWGITSVLDMMRERRKKLNTTPEESVAIGKTTEQMARSNQGAITSLDDKFDQCVALARELAQDNPPLRLMNIADWNGKLQEGILVQLRLYERTDALNIVRCQDLDDLQKLMRP